MTPTGAPPGPPADAPVLVMGGGPAGSTVAALLARAGLEPVLLERERFPRYHVGESLLPSVRPLLELSGAWDDVASSGFQRKEGAVLRWGGEEWRFDWRPADGAPSGPVAYQVERAVFDEVLLRSAQRQGVEVHEECRVTGVDVEGGRPVAVRWRTARASGRTEAGVVVDATGQAGVLAHGVLRSRRHLEPLRNVAIWSYVRGARLPQDEPLVGPVLVEATAHGWLWAIPLAGDLLSVGAVGHRDDLRPVLAEGPEHAFRRLLDESELVRSVCAGATRCAPVRTRTDYSHLADRLGGPGFVVVGDAGGFIDPLLSSGVHLALTSAVLGAAATTSAVTGLVDEGAAARFHDTAVRRNFLRWLLLVTALYQRGGSRSALESAASDLARSDVDTTLAQVPDVVSGAVSGLPDVGALAGGGARLHTLTRLLAGYGDDLLGEFVAHATGEGGPMRLLDGFDATGLAARHAVDDLYVASAPHVHLRRRTR